MGSVKVIKCKSFPIRPTFCSNLCQLIKFLFIRTTRPFDLAVKVGTAWFDIDVPNSPIFDMAHTLGGKIIWSRIRGRYLFAPYEF